MRLSRITLENFRNIPLAELTLDGRQQFLLGQNGQGKTNLLEAVGYLTALRSFRTSDQRLLDAPHSDKRDPCSRRAAWVTSALPRAGNRSR